MSAIALQPSAWQIHGHAAVLRQSTLQAAVDLARPDRGLSELEFQGGRLTGQQVLGVVIAPGELSCTASLVDHYARVSDLVATYAEIADRPTRVQIYWRIDKAAEAIGASAVDLQVSVQTSLLDSNSELRTASTLAAAETYVLANVGAMRFEQLAISAGPPQSLVPADGPGCLLFRLQDAAVSYVEMVHPADFRQCKLVIDAAEKHVHIEQRLFAAPLEKGVILRARLRGLFVPRDRDMATAIESYKAFVDARLPLTT